ncbi:MAG: hypothetical protein ACLVG5_05555 [Clostridium sp.]
MIPVAEWHGATAVSETVSAYGQKNQRGIDDNAALDAANDGTCGKSKKVNLRLYHWKEKRQRNNRLRNVLEETENPVCSRYQCFVKQKGGSERSRAEETACIKEITAEKALPEAISGCETGKSCEGRSACKCTAIYGKSQSCG